MSVDKFGRTASRLQHKHGFQDVEQRGVILDMENGRIINIGNPTEDSDVASKSYVDAKIEETLFELFANREKDLKIIITDYVTLAKADLVDKLYDYLFKNIPINATLSGKEPSESDVVTVGLLLKIIQRWRSTA